MWWRSKTRQRVPERLRLDVTIRWVLHKIQFCMWQFYWEIKLQLLIFYALHILYFFNVCISPPNFLKMRGQPIIVTKQDRIAPNIKQTFQPHWVENMMLQLTVSTSMLTPSDEAWCACAKARREASCKSTGVNWWSLMQAAQLLWAECTRFWKGTMMRPVHSTISPLNSVRKYIL